MKKSELKEENKRLRETIDNQRKSMSIQKDNCLNQKSERMRKDMEIVTNLLSRHGALEIEEVVHSGHLPGTGRRQIVIKLESPLMR